MNIYARYTLESSVDIFPHRRHANIHSLWRLKIDAHVCAVYAICVFGIFFKAHTNSLPKNWIDGTRYGLKVRAGKSAWLMIDCASAYFKSHKDAYAVSMFAIVRSFLGLILSAGGAESTAIGAMERHGRGSHVPGSAVECTCAARCGLTEIGVFRAARCDDFIAGCI